MLKRSEATNQVPEPRTARVKINPVTRFLLRHAVVVGLVGTLLAIVGGYCSVLLYKNLRTDIEELLPTQARSGRDLGAATNRLNAIDSFAVLVYSQDVKASERFVDALAGRLQVLPKDLVGSV